MIIRDAHKVMNGVKYMQDLFLRSRTLDKTAFAGSRTRAEIAKIVVRGKNNLMDNKVK